MSTLKSTTSSPNSKSSGNSSDRIKTYSSSSSSSRDRQVSNNKFVCSIEKEKYIQELNREQKKMIFFYFRILQDRDRERDKERDRHKTSSGNNSPKLKVKCIQCLQMYIL